MSTKSSAKAHELMPAFSFSGDQGLDGAAYTLVPRVRRDRPRLRQHRLQGLGRSAARRSHRARPARSACPSPSATSTSTRRSPSPRQSRTTSRRARTSPGLLTGDRSPRPRPSGPRRESRPPRTPTADESQIRRPGARRPAGHRLPEHAVLLDGRPGRVPDQPDRQPQGKGLRRHRVAAGRVPVGPRRELRQGERRGQDRQRLRPRSSRASPRAAASSTRRTPSRSSTRPRSSPGSRRPAPPPTRCSGRGRGIRGAPRAP